MRVKIERILSDGTIHPIRPNTGQVVFPKEKSQVVIRITQTTASVTEFKTDSDCAQYQGFTRWSYPYIDPERIFIGKLDDGCSYRVTILSYKTG